MTYELGDSCLSGRITDESNGTKVEELRSLEGATNRAYALRQGGSNNEGGLPQVLAIPRKFLPRVRKPNGPPKFKGVARNRMIVSYDVMQLYPLLIPFW